MTEERWAPAPGFETSYEVSDQGRVRSIARVVALGSHSRRIAAHVRKPVPDHNGNGMVLLTNGPVRKLCAVHRLVALAFLPPPADGRTQVSRHDFDQSNNRATNLFWSTHAESQARAGCAGHFLQKIPLQAIPRMIADRARGHSYSKIARSLGVKYSSVREVLRVHSHPPLPRT